MSPDADPNDLPEPNHDATPIADAAPDASRCATPDDAPAASPSRCLPVPFPIRQHDSLRERAVRRSGGAAGKVGGWRAAPARAP